MHTTPITEYLHAYTYKQPPAVRAMVDAMHNCEDLAMQFLVANATQQPPVWVHVRHLLDYGQVCVFWGGR